MAAFMGFRWRGRFGGGVDWGSPFLFTNGVNMNVLYYPLSGCKFLAALMQTALASGKIRLFKDTLTPTPDTPLADYVTAEADFTGYPSTGTTVTAWNAPILSPTGGYQIQCPMVQFKVGSSPSVGNVIGGWFYTETGGALVAAGTFGTPQPMQIADAGIDLAPVLTFPTGV